MQLLSLFLAIPKPSSPQMKIMPPRQNGYQPPQDSPRNLQQPMSRMVMRLRNAQQILIAPVKVMFVLITCGSTTSNLSPLEDAGISLSVTKAHSSCLMVERSNGFVLQKTKIQTWQSTQCMNLTKLQNNTGQHFKLVAQPIKTVLTKMVSLIKDAQISSGRE